MKTNGISGADNPYKLNLYGLNYGSYSKHTTGDAEKVQTTPQISTSYPVEGTRWSQAGIDAVNRVSQNSSNLVGVNDKLGPGSEISGQIQMGKKQGGRTICFA